MGELVLFERYPLFFPHGDDTPNTIFSDEPGLRRQPGLLIMLDVSEQSAMSRRPYDDHDVLKRKIAAFRRFTTDGVEGTSEVVILDADTCVATNVAMVLERLGERLADEARRFGAP
jgi:hypothetical protein